MTIRSLPRGVRNTKKSAGKSLLMRRLAQAGLSTTNRHGLYLLPEHGLSELDQSMNRCARLSRVLDDLGPVFALFGLYMATRADLLNTQACLQLSAIRDSGDAEPLYPDEDSYSRWEKTPFEVRRASQYHRAWLDDGTSVTVRTVRNEVRERLGDLAELPLLEKAFTGRSWKTGVFDAALTDFARRLEERMDLSYEKRALDKLSRDAGDLSILHVPRVLQLGGENRVLEMESAPRGEAQPDQLAKLLAAAWMRQALTGQVFPIDPLYENVTAVTAGRIAFTCCEWASLTPETQANLMEYLVAVDTGDPDKACTCLLKEMVNRERCPREEELLRAFRQMVPFRHPESAISRDGQKLAERLLLQWRFASDLGYIPMPHVPSFYRGLFTLARVTEVLAPHRDSVSEGLRDIRVFDAMTRFREMAAPQQLGEMIDKYAAQFLELPQRMDKFFAIGADGCANIRVTLAENPGQRKQKNLATVRYALLIVGTAIVMAANSEAAKFGEVWASRINTLVFVLLGSLILWAVVRAK